jgi:hypothetical protein
MKWDGYGNSKMASEKKPLEYQDIVDEGLKAVIRSFGKGEDLRSAVSYIVIMSLNWRREMDEAEAKKVKKV